MTALLNMDTGEFDEQPLTSESDKTSDNLLEENRALREENQWLKEQLRDTTTQKTCSHPGKKKVCRVLPCFFFYIIL